MYRYCKSRMEDAPLGTDKILVLHTNSPQHQQPVNLQYCNLKHLSELQRLCLKLYSLLYYLEKNVWEWYSNFIFVFDLFIRWWNWTFDRPKNVWLLIENVIFYGIQLTKGSFKVCFSLLDLHSFCFVIKLVCYWYLRLFRMMISKV